MISADEEKYIFSKAYIPEHIPNLMVPISGGEPFLDEGYLCFAKENWLIFIGYPLGGDFLIGNLEKALKGALEKFSPDYVWLIAPEMPAFLVPSCRERESDYYYRLELKRWEIGKDLMRTIRKASRELRVTRGREISKEHGELISEFLEREKPDARIRELFLSMEEYVALSETSCVLTASNPAGKITAFYVVEIGADKFATYVVGAHSKKDYVPGSSDLLFFEMVNLALAEGKSYIHLGLGVNEGIKRFKGKWGGVPFLKYEFCRYVLTDKKAALFKTIGSGLWV